MELWPVGVWRGRPCGLVPPDCRDRADGPFAFVPTSRLELFSSFILRLACCRGLQLTSPGIAKFSFGHSAKPRNLGTPTLTDNDLLCVAMSLQTHHQGSLIQVPIQTDQTYFQTTTGRRGKGGINRVLYFLSQLIYSSLQRQCFRNKLPCATRHASVSMQAVCLPPPPFSPS